jgi:hypothetical protein
MKQRLCAATILVLALALSSAAAAEEQADGLPARSFSDLQRWLTEGERLIVRDSSGSKTHWRVVSLSGDKLEMKRSRWNLRTERRTWTEATVQEIQHEDSKWEGAVIGAAIGLAADVIMLKSPKCDLYCAPFVFAAMPLGMLIGRAIDGSINLTLYESPVVSRFPIELARPRQRGIVLSYQLSLDR